MHVISRKALRMFWQCDPDSEQPLRRWHKLVTTTDFGSFAELRETFPSADTVDDLTVFNIGGKGKLEAMTTQLADLQAYWTPIAPLFSLQNEAEYDAAVERLNALVDEIGTNQKHPLYTLLDTLGTLIHTYEEQHHAIPGVTGTDVLQFLMEEHGLSAINLPELGPPEAVERYLAGKQELSIHQVRSLARRFHVSPTAFI